MLAQKTLLHLTVIRFHFLQFFCVLVFERFQCVIEIATLLVQVFNMFPSQLE
jgi:hypothetical protein